LGLGWVTRRIGHALSLPQRTTTGAPPAALSAAAVEMTRGTRTHAWQVRTCKASCTCCTVYALIELPSAVHSGFVIARLCGVVG
ncbi:MAG: hypothetical protein RSD57_07945, partial [Comamonas sp.]